VSHPQERSKSITDAIVAKRRSDNNFQAARQPSWKELLNRRQSEPEKKQCAASFGAWEANAKREKAAWLRKREMEAEKRKRAATARKSLFKEH
jgi:hypothetical protein